MKKAIVILILMASIGSISWKLIADKSAARAEMYQGYYIYLFSKPVSQYEYLGTVKSGSTWSGKFDQYLEQVIKKAKKDFPNADALVFNGTEVWQCDAIKFKE